MARPLGTCSFGTTNTCAASALPTTACLTFNVGSFDNVAGDRPYRNGVAALTGRLKVSKPASPLGTVVLMAGGGGGGWFEQLANCLANVCTPLYNAGYTLVQVAWDDPNPPANTAGVFSGSQGPLALMVRTATLFKGIYDNASVHTHGLPFILCGQSGGSSQVAYAIAHYGSTSFVDMAIICSGPPHGRLDYGCMTGSPNTTSKLPAWNAIVNTYKTVSPGGLAGFIAGASATFIDWSYGAAFDGSGFSATNAQSLAGGPDNMGAQDSVWNGSAVLAYPQTDLRLLYGDGDSSEAPPLGRVVTSRMTGKSKTEQITTGNIDHVNVPGSASGSAYIVASVQAATFNH